MVSFGKFRNEDLSVLFFIKGLINSKVNDVIDGYPYNLLEDETLNPPCVSVEHSLTSDGDGEMGASWFRREWEVNIFAKTDTQRDELSDIIYKGLDNAIPIRDYSVGFKANGKSLAGIDLRIIEYMQPEDRSMRPVYGFDSEMRVKFWRMSITFETVSTQAT